MHWPRDPNFDDVSIRARRCRRAMPPPCAGAWSCRCFNPRPSLPTGDAPGQREVGALDVVSIRARRCRRAMPAWARCAPSSGAFQSAPVVADGRCSAPPAAPDRRRSFNPRPSLPTGDAPNVASRSAILARFNPRPSLPTGDAYARRRGRADEDVSIRARRCRRAMRATQHRQTQNIPVSIRARRCRRAMHPAYQATTLVLGVSIRARRCRRAMPACASSHGSSPSCFNPRPSLPTGDATPQVSQMSLVFVSIRARRCRRAMPGNKTRKRVTGFVSIRARRCRRAMPAPFCGHGRAAVFQSAPVVADGRCRQREKLAGAP